MVLEGASGPQTDSYDNGSLTSDSPYSDMDPYESSSSSPSTSSYPVDFSTCSKPMPIMSNMTGYSRPRFEKMVTEMVNGTQKRLNRQLTPEESQGLAQAYAKGYSYGSWGDGIGVLAGWAKCYQRADTFKWPIGENLRVQNPDRLGPLRGPAARMGWHALRSIPYGLLGWAIVGTFGNAYGATMVMVLRSRDPRLTDVDKQLVELVKQGRPQAEAKRAMEKATPYDGYGKEEANVQFDDMSPQSTADGALLSDSQMRIEESRQQEDARRPKPVEDRITSREERRDWDRSRGTQPSNTDPRAGKPANDPLYGMSSAEQQAASGSSKESAWDRLRREAAERANR
jgi:hypothetical protein